MVIERKDRFNIMLNKIMAKAQAKLHVKPSALVLLDWDIKDAYGNAIKKHTGRSHSVTRNFSNMNFLNGTLGLPQIGTTNVAGSSVMWTKANARALTVGAQHQTVASASGINTSGIVVGTSATAEAFGDYVLGTVIAHGNGSGQMAYGALTQLTTWNSGPKTFTNAIQRTFTNNYSGSITINEIGIYDSINTDPTSYTSVESLCILRDVPTPIVVASAASVTITYTFTYQFP